ncbi:MAG: molybdopterin converting factor subunit 1 [Alphaproteobacteria bacterium]
MRILYFAWLRTRIGKSSETLPVPAEVTTVAALMEWLKARDPAYAVAFGNGAAIRAAVNQRLARPGDAIGPGDEVAFFPPLTGG